jgi:hypothetical protein
MRFRFTDIYMRIAYSIRYHRHKANCDSIVTKRRYSLVTDLYRHSRRCAQYQECTTVSTKDTITVTAHRTCHYYRRTLGHSPKRILKGKMAQAQACMVLKGKGHPPGSSEVKAMGRPSMTLSLLSLSSVACRTAGVILFCGYNAGRLLLLLL